MEMDMGQSIPIGPWPDFETAEAFGGNAIKAAADRNGEIVTEWAAVRRDDGLWMAEGFCHPLDDLGREGTFIVAGASNPEVDRASR
jgi:hypothetical protein